MRHKQIFSFAAGWLKNDENTLKTYWKLIREEPRDLIGLYAIDLEMCCLNEAGAPKTLMASWLPDLMAWCNKYWFNRQEENDWEETRPIVASLSDYFSKNFLVSNYCLRENESSEILSNCKVLEDSLCDNEKSIRVHAAEKLSFYAKAFPSQSSVIVGWLLKASSHQDLNICTETMAALGQLASIIPAVAPSVVRELYSNYKKWPNLKVGQVAMVTLIQWLKVNSSIDTDKFIEELRKVFDVNAISVLAHIAPLAAHSHIEPIIDQLLEK
ncbi:MAG: hypothetical protein HWD59_00930 [Coxiellaceae bacterium]|nr:MAG: hypothetical protein HWD59_00930 [Coxiellaceae bacterium]